MGLCGPDVSHNNKEGTDSGEAGEAGLTPTVTRRVLSLVQCK